MVSRGAKAGQCHLIYWLSCSHAYGTAIPTQKVSMETRRVIKFPGCRNFPYYLHW